jgi:hypothetical protein
MTGEHEILSSAIVSEEEVLVESQYVCEPEGRDTGALHGESEARYGGIWFRLERQNRSSARLGLAIPILI